MRPSATEILMKSCLLPSTLPERGLRAGKASPVVIATDGLTQSDHALVIGRALAGSPEALRVISVTQPLPVIPESVMAASVELTLSRRAETQRHVIAQMTRTWEDLVPPDIHEGDPATVIARVAHESNATMVVCGLGRHRIADRIFGNETALRLMRFCDVPVFAAAQGSMRQPTRIVVGCDFSETSLRAARMAAALAAPYATIYLVHVAPRDTQGDADWARSYRQEAAEALLRINEQLRPSPDTMIERILLEGDPATEVLAFATGVKADLIATGSHGYGFVARTLIGSVATRIVRTSTCSVLTVPQAAAMVPDTVVRKILTEVHRTADRGRPSKSGN